MIYISLSVLYFIRQYLLDTKSYGATNRERTLRSSFILHFHLIYAILILIKG